MADINYTKPNKLEDFSAWCSKKYPLWCKSNFPFIEDTFEALDTYGLICKIVQYLNETKQNLNTTEDNVQNIYNFVTNYFDNLDVQDEINNKLDEMTTDGTLERLINIDIINSLKDDITEVEQNLVNTNQNLLNTNQNLNSLKINKLRKKLTNNFNFFEMPISLNSFFKKLKIFKSYEDENFYHNLTKENLKFNINKTVYVDNINGTDSSLTEGTKENPFKTLSFVIRNAVEDLNIILLNDIHYRNTYSHGTLEYKYNFNIIAEKENTIFVDADNLEYTKTEGYNNVYESDRTNALQCFDIRNRNKGIIIPLKEVNDIYECDNNINSYLKMNGKVYVNIGEEVNSEKVVFDLGVSTSPINLSISTTPIKLYFENIIFLGGNRTAINLISNNDYVHELNAVNCKFLYNKDSNLDGFSNRGCKSILMFCESSMNKKDGFNYHQYNDNKAYGIEINCLASFNGLNNEDNYYNGTTAHDGCQVIRMNGNYFKNKGGNVADVHENTISINFNCNAFDSLSTEENGTNTDFVAQQEGTKMYLYNCFSKGSKSKYNLYATANNAFVYYNTKTEFDSKYGDGVIEI